MASFEQAVSDGDVPAQQSPYLFAPTESPLNGSWLPGAETPEIGTASALEPVAMGCFCCHGGRHGDGVGVADDGVTANPLSLANESLSPVDAVEGHFVTLGADKQAIKVYLGGAGFVSTFAQFDVTTEWTGEEDWTQAEIDIIRGLLDDIEALIDVEFVITDTATGADLEIFKNDDSGSLGTAGSYSYGSYAGASVRINHTISGRWENGKEKGGQGYETLVHEIGHALGLGHTHDTSFSTEVLQGMDGYSAFSGGALGINDPINSIMAYRDGWAAEGTSTVSHGNRANFGAWDIAALINRYGANLTAATGDDIYVLPEANATGTYFETIFDQGGTDAISAIGSSFNAVIDLRAATLDYEVETTGGPVSHLQDGGGTVRRGGFTIANGSEIENAFGGDGDDTLTGNAGANLLDGGVGEDLLTGDLGDDTLLGGAGNDTIDAGSGAAVIDAGEGDDQITAELDLEAVIEAGDGSDFLDLVLTGALSGTVTISLGTGVDTLDLDWDGAAIGFRAITITDFEAGASGDLIILDDLLADNLLGWDTVSNPFDAGQGFLRLVQDGADAVFELDEDGGADGFVELIRFTGQLITDLTDNFVGLTPVTELVAVAGDDAAATDAVTAISAIVVLPNDAASDGGDLSIVSFDSSGTSGVVTNNGDGTFAYDPNGAYTALGGGEFATDSFTYTVEDAQGETATATVTITIEGTNDNPTAVADDFVIEAGTSFTLSDLLANDTDPDTNDGLSIVALELANTIGELTEDGEGNLVYDPAGRFTYLGLGEEAEDSFLYTVTDGNGAESVAIVTITIVGENDGPTAEDDEAETDEDTVISIIDLLGNDTDPDQNDRLVLEDIDISSTLGLVTQNVDGTFSYDPNGQFEALGAGETATDSFSYSITDGFGARSTATVTITITGIRDTDDAVLVGSGAADLLASSDGADALYGQSGEDTLNGGGGNDTISGSAGNDLANGQGGDDQLFGGDGEDTLAGGLGRDLLVGNAGRDELFGGAGEDDLRGGNGADRLAGGADADRLFGGQAGDQLFGGTGNDTLLGGDGDDLVTGFDDDDVVSGNLGADTLYGGQGRDLVNGGNGNDFASGNAGQDSLFGGTGADTLDGGLDDDEVAGGDGDDRISGNTGNDTVFGGAGRDQVIGGEGDDSLVGNADDDELFGGNGQDTINGGEGNDLATGNAGDDLLLGASGNDTLLGAEGADELIGGNGDDSLAGNQDNDTLTGGGGNDTLIGGYGDDFFVFAGTTGADVIFGFAAGAGSEDVIALNGFGAAFDEFADVLAAASDDGTDTTIDLGGGNTLTLTGVTVAALHEDDFLFG